MRSGHGNADFRRYGLTALIVLLALAASRATSSFLGNTAAYILLLGFVVAASRYLGLGPAISTMGLAVIGVQFRFVQGRHSPALGTTILLLLVATALIAIEEVSRRRSLRLSNQEAELEDQMRERTAELDAANQGLRELSGRLLHLQDEERRRIARELHDSVGQLLVSLSLNLSTARSSIERLREETSILSDCERLVDELSKQVRTISHLLHPPLLDEAGLCSAIQWYVGEFARRSNIRVEVDVPRDLGRLSRDIEIAIFRVVQECLTNIHRHSGSSKATIGCRRVKDRVLVEIEDAGKGISPEKLEKINSNRTSGVGIRGMRERIRQLGGDLKLHSSLRGTVLIAMFPVERPAIENTLKLSEKGSSAVA